MKKRHLQTNFLMFLVEKYEEEIQALKNNSLNHIDQEEGEEEVETDTDTEDFDTSNENPKDEIVSSNNIVKKLALEYKNKTRK
jgi:hypothetical protein